MTTTICEPSITKSHKLSSGIDWRGMTHTKFRAGFDLFSLRHKDRVTTVLYLLTTKRDVIQFHRKSLLDVWKAPRAHDNILRQIIKYNGYLHFDHESSIQKTKSLTKSVKTSYVDRPSVEHLLDHVGKQVLSKIVSLIEEVRQEYSWPLDKIEIRYVKDSEINDWEYVLIRLLFVSDFDTADGYLHNLYRELDVISNKLSTEEKDRFQRLFYYDVTATTVSVH